MTKTFDDPIFACGGASLQTDYNERWVHAAAVVHRQAVASA